MSAPFSRKHLSAAGLLSEARRLFASIPEQSGCDIALVDHLMSGLALFGLKYPRCCNSRTTAGKRRRAPISRRSTGSSVRRATPAFANVSMNLTRATCARCTRHCWHSCSAARGWRDSPTSMGITYSRSTARGISRPQRSIARNAGRSTDRNGTITYYHQMLGAVLVHPDRSEVFPLAPEPILKQDGARKNDCERNAAKRLLTDLRREHPHRS